MPIEITPELYKDSATFAFCADQIRAVFGMANTDQTIRMPNGGKLSVSLIATRDVENNGKCPGYPDRFTINATNDIKALYTIKGCETYKWKNFKECFDRNNQQNVVAAHRMQFQIEASKNEYTVYLTFNYTYENENDNTPNQNNGASRNRLRV